MLRAREPVRSMKEYHPPLSGRDGLRLDFNENVSGCSPRVLAKLREMVGDQLARYPEREPVERRVADFLKVPSPIVLLTNGVDEGIHLLCETYLERGDNALIVTPTFGMYEIFAQQTGARVVTVPADPREGFAFPTAKVIAAMNASTRLIAIASPNNPTGTVVSHDDLVQVLKAAPGAAVLVDEAYYEFYGKSFLPQLVEYPNLFVARTFSKAYGLAGFRVGILVGNAEEMKLVRKVASPYNVNGVALACLQEAIADSDYVRDYSQQVRAGRNRLQRELHELGVPFWPSEANFVLMRIGEKRLDFVRAMRDRGILVRDRNSDPGCSGCVRITLGTETHTDLLLSALRECLTVIAWAPEVEPQRATV